MTNSILGMTNNIMGMTNNIIGHDNNDVIPGLTGNPNNE